MIKIKTLAGQRLLPFGGCHRYSYLTKKRAAVVLMYVAQRMGIEEDDRRFRRGKALSFLSRSLRILPASSRRTAQRMGGKRRMPTGPKLVLMFHITASAAVVFGHSFVSSLIRAQVVSHSLT